MGKLRPCGGKDLPRHTSLQNQSLGIPMLPHQHSLIALSCWMNGETAETAVGAESTSSGLDLNWASAALVSFTEGSPQNWPGLVQWWRWYHGVLSSLVSCWNSFIHLSAQQIFIEPRDRKALLTSPKQCRLPTSSEKNLFAVVKRDRPVG